MAPPKPLPRAALVRRTDPAGFAFKTTDELAPLEEIFGQARAVEAVCFGIGIRQEGYNLFALGPTGMGKHKIVRPVPRASGGGRCGCRRTGAMCTTSPSRTGRRRCACRRDGARAFGVAMDQLVEELRSAIPAAFEGDEYRARRQVGEEEMKERHETAFGGLQRRAGPGEACRAGAHVHGHRVGTDA